MTPEEILIDDEFLAWYYSKKSDSARVWEARINESPELKGKTLEACRILDALVEDITAHPITDQQVIASYQSLNKRIAQWEGTGQVKRWWHLSKREVLRVAAAFLLLFVGIWVVLDRVNSTETYLTDAKDTRTIVLEDGTTVRLNKKSELRVADFSKEIREVWLSGEAYFDVKPVAHNKKFIVHNGDLDVEVIGTQFNVKTKAEGSEVVLESGKVKLLAEKLSPVLVAPGEKVLFNKEVKVFEKELVNTAIFTSWKDDLVIFEDASFEEILDVLKFNYGLEVSLQPGVELGAFNGEFSSKSPDVLLKALEKAYDVRLEKNGNKIVIYP